MLWSYQVEYPDVSDRNYIIFYQIISVSTICKNVAAADHNIFN